MKSFNGLTCSIKKDSNRIVSVSETSWNGIKLGSFLRLDGDVNFYQIAKIDNFVFSKTFNVLTDSCKITVKGDVGIDIFTGDKVRLFYNEYELLAVAEPKEKGASYKPNDELYVASGVVVTDKVENKNLVTKFKVLEVDEAGGITKFGILEKGLYYQKPLSGTVVGGSGSGAIFDLEYDTVAKKKFIEVFIRAVVPVEGKTILILDTAIDGGIIEGVLTVEKSEIYISSSYLGDTRTGVKYNIYSDFTPTLSLPLLQRGSQNNELLINQAFSKIDAAVTDLYSRLEKINQRI